MEPQAPSSIKHKKILSAIALGLLLLIVFSAYTIPHTDTRHATAVTSLEGQDQSFDSNRAVSPDTGATVGFPRKSVLARLLPPIIWHDARTYFFYPLPFLIVLLWYRKRLAYWLKRRNFYERNTIIPEYDPGPMSVLEAAGIMNGTISNKDISAFIVQLAIDGYIVIKSVDDEFVFEPTTKDTAALDQNSKAILATISGQKESDLADAFYATAVAVEDKEMKSLLIREYIQSYIPQRSSVRIPMVIVPFFLAVNPGALIWALVGIPAGYIFSASCVLIGICNLCLGPRRVPLTDKGLASEHKLRGLKLYISVAEKDRMEFANVPVKTPELFEKLLPYAIVFGLEKNWASEKEFEGLYSAPPEWCAGMSTTAFSTTAFVSAMPNFTPARALPNSSNSSS